MQKYITRTISILLLIAMLCTLAACQSAGTLSEGMQQEISDAWLKEKGEELDWSAKYLAGGEKVKYYGEYSGFVAFFVGYDECTCGAMHDVFVADYGFEHYQPFELAVYKDGALNSLQEAYDNGWLTKDQIGQIYEVHENSYPSEE